MVILQIRGITKRDDRWFVAVDSISGFSCGLGRLSSCFREANCGR